MERKDILKIEVPALADDPNSLTSGPIQFNDSWPGFYLRGVIAIEIAGGFTRWIEAAKKNGLEIPPGLEFLASEMKRCAVDTPS